MRQGLAWLLAAVLLGTFGCTPDRGMATRRDAGPRTDGGGGGGARDEDGDGISDSWEGRSDNTDTDGDGTPDYLDDDSDNDGVPDALEGGVSAGDEPRDSDGDGVYDFRDDDSDGNGLTDRFEGGGDTDGDRIPDSSDLDNDGDNIADRDEIGGDSTRPVDFDGDATADYMDTDSDGDSIGDLHEMAADTDLDMTLDRHDLDSDNDGWTDADEAGDTDVTTPPADTDADFIADFRDPDSDGDGLSDADERTYGTSRTSVDTDGDGVSDLVEIAGCPAGDATCAMDATDPMSSPRTRGDFVFLEPYMMAPDPMRDTLVFSTDLRVADVYFLMDTTGSMGGAITSLRTSLSRAGGIIEQVRAEIADVWFGVGGFDDYQVAPYGYATSGDRAYYHLTDMTPDVATAQAGVNMLATHYGGDGPESQFPAMYSVASGLGLPGMSGWGGNRADGFGGFAPCPADRPIGWPCFRSGAVPIVVSITDIDSHNGPGDSNLYTAAGADVAPRYTATLAALTGANVRVIGISVYGGGNAHLSAIATDTGAVDAAGMPLVSTWSGGEISTAVVDQIRTLANQTPIDISITYQDDATDTVDTYLAFVDHIEANTVGDIARGCDPHAAEDTNGDGWLDTFRGVTPGSPACFDIVVKQNDTVMPTPMPQLFKATLHVLGDGFTELDTRDIFFLVPPRVEIIGPG